MAVALEFEARSLRVSCAFLVPFVEFNFVANSASSDLLGPKTRSAEFLASLRGLRPALDNGAAPRLGKARGRRFLRRRLSARPRAEGCCSQAFPGRRLAGYTNRLA